MTITSFDKYNSLCFDCKTTLPRIRIGHAKNYLGQLRYKVRKDKSGKRIYSDFSLNISRMYELEQQNKHGKVVPCRQRGNQQATCHSDGARTGGQCHQTKEAQQRTNKD